MKKRISAVCLATVLSVFSATVVQAATPLQQALIDSGVRTTRDLPVTSDITLKKDADLSFVNGPVRFENVTEGSVHIVDVKADIDLSAVTEAVTLYEAGALLVIQSKVNNLVGDQAAKDALDLQLKGELATCEVEGSFTINVTYPEAFEITDTNFLDTARKDMYGFSSDANKHEQIFYEISRTITDTQATIEIGVKDDVTIQTLKDNLCNLALTCENAEITKSAANTDTITIAGVVTGSTNIMSGTETLGTVTYNFTQRTADDTEINTDTDADYVDPEGDNTAITGTIILTKATPPSSDTGSSVAQKVTLTVVMGGDMENDEYKYTKTVIAKLSSLKTPVREGYVFSGYYLDPEFTQAAPATIQMFEDKTIYVKWVELPGEPDIDKEQGVHEAYIKGYPSENGEQMVRPEGNITREEVATIFYRVTDKAITQANFTLENNFSDVEMGRWSNDEISTDAKLGYVNGYEDGTFRPSGMITRAEFVTMASRYWGAEIDNAAEPDFTDVANHWAKGYIHFAVECGWIDGYEDGTFRPDQYITRAEAIKIVNHMLYRAVDEDGLVEGIRAWDDNPKDEWYYYEMIEATNTHRFERAQNEKCEDWLEITGWLL